MKIIPALFEHHEIRRVFDEKTETWFFSVVDIIQVLIQQPDYRAARNYWKVLKNRLAKESSQSVTNCNQLKLPAADGKSCLVLRCYRRAGGGRFDAPKGHRSKLSTELRDFSRRRKDFFRGEMPGYFPGRIVPPDDSVNSTNPVFML